MESTAIPIYHLETSPQFNLDALAIIPLPSAWDQINAALSRSISTPSELVELLATVAQAVGLTGEEMAKSMSTFADWLSGLPEAERTHFFTVQLPSLFSHAKALRTLLPSGVPVLRAGRPGCVCMTRAQAAAIVAGGFVGLWPACANSPTLHFAPLLIHASTMPSERAKLQAILHYFTRIATETPKGILRVERFVLVQSPDWANSIAPLTSLMVSARGYIENTRDTLQVDFANMSIGGGVLDGGCVQEEIRFAICPELLVSMLVTEVMRDDEAIVIAGHERFANYRGYGRSLEFAGDHVDPTPRDTDGSMRNALVAIDAMDYRWTGRISQYTTAHATRELNKALCGFRVSYPQHAPDGPVASGNWGCGAFLGDRQHKAVLQWLAASQAGRALIYLTFEDEPFSVELTALADALTSRQPPPTVGEIYRAVQRYEFAHFPPVVLPATSTMQDGSSTFALKMPARGSPPSFLPWLRQTLNCA